MIAFAVALTKLVGLVAKGARATQSSESRVEGSQALFQRPWKTSLLFSMMKNVTRSILVIGLA